MFFFFSCPTLVYVFYFPLIIRSLIGPLFFLNPIIHKNQTMKLEMNIEQKDRLFLLLLYTYETY
jgi:hypothetical protein